MKDWKKRILFSLVGFIFVFDGLVWYAVAKESRGDILTVSFLDIGQGDSIFIDAPSGNQVLIDGGPGSIVLHRLGEVMPFYDRSVDALIVSNPDKDHFAGFVDVLNRYEVHDVIEPGTVSATAIYHTFKDLVAKKHIPDLLLKTGDRIVLDEKRGVVLDILFPDRDVSGLAINDGSLVARLSYRNICFMMMGDAPQKIEEYLMHLFSPEALHCQVLKVGHHGSRTSTSANFVQAVAPEYAVISDGKDNKYGHPHQETLDTLNNFGVNILRTDELGTITFTTDGNKIKIKK